MVATVSITCPSCGHTAVEPMPDTCCICFYECLGCRALIQPRAGDCCVFCSYGDRRCPSASVTGASPA